MAVVASGDWWSLDDNGTLNIFCTGDMPDYSLSQVAQFPWYSYRSSIYTCVIADTVTSVGQNALANCSNLTDVRISDSVSVIKGAAFRYNTALISIGIPASITEIYDSAFAGCENLEDVYYSGTEAQWDSISIGEDNNEYFTSATIHYNSELHPEPPAIPAPEYPVINTQPVSAAYSFYETPAPLSVEACVSDGGTLSYQWFRSSIAGTRIGTGISGAVGRTYMPSTRTAGTFYYFVVVGNTLNGATSLISSDVVSITVNAPQTGGAEQKAVYINGTNFTSFFPFRGQTIEYVIKTGGNEGEMQDGTYKPDEIARKAVITFQLIPLSAAQDAQLTNALYLSDSVELVYWDRIAQNYKTISTKRPALSPAKYRGIGPDGKEYWQAGTLTFEEL